MCTCDVYVCLCMYVCVCMYVSAYNVCMSGVKVHHMAGEY